MLFEKVANVQVLKSKEEKRKQMLFIL